MDLASPEPPFLYCHLVHWPGCLVSVITWKISKQDPGISVLGSELTGLARLSGNRNFDFCCVYNYRVMLSGP